MKYCASAFLVLCTSAVCAKSYAAHTETNDVEFIAVESQSLWPGCLMVVAGVYLIVHILQDLLQVYRIVCLCGTKLTNIFRGVPENSVQNEVRIVETAVESTDGGTIDGAEQNVTARPQNARMESFSQDDGDRFLHNQNVNSGTGIGGIHAAESRTRVQCRCVNEQMHVSGLPIAEPTRDHWESVPKVWTTAEGATVHCATCSSKKTQWCARE